MERDSRRDRCQWRGCHTFNNIICDGDQVGNTERTGGLKMGQTYYYYYELDGSTETHDPSLPTTNNCPYLPGQTVNTLDVPVEQHLRARSASMNSLRISDFRTLDPKDKFTAPRPAPPVPGRSEPRIGSSPSMAMVYKREARSLSPVPRWTGTARRILRLKSSKGDLGRGRMSIESDSDNLSLGDNASIHEPRSVTPTGSSRTRDMSPESLRRFLSDDLPCLTPPVEPAPKLWIPDDIVEENEDDENFATSAASESLPFTTLSPPPFLRSHSAPSIRTGKNESTATIVPESPKDLVGIPPPPAYSPPSIPNFKLDIPRSHFSFSTVASDPSSPHSIESRDYSQYSYLDDTDDEDDDFTSHESDLSPHHSIRPGTDQSKFSAEHTTGTPFTGYSLPLPHVVMNSSKDTQTRHMTGGALGSPALIARNENGVPVGNTNLLSRPGFDTGLDDLVNDMGWMADVIHPKDI
ncbi:hypothetical protein F4778DRAFT_725059 [Xylariomycetidae sp. FL2044]|nr:hypothetical protein F4778DRAFT_725059 [Xylariomycetidae sp. FL2044]